MDARGGYLLYSLSSGGGKLQRGTGRILFVKADGNVATWRASWLSRKGLKENRAPLSAKRFAFLGAENAACFVAHFQRNDVHKNYNSKVWTNKLLFRSFKRGKEKRK